MRPPALASRRRRRCRRRQHPADVPAAHRPLSLPARRASGCLTRRFLGRLTHRGLAPVTKKDLEAESLQSLS